LALSASYDLHALIEGAGSCTFNGQKRFPKIPKTKTACSGYFCIALMIQAVVDLTITGSLEGSLEVGVGGDFGVSASVGFNIATGDAETKLSATEFEHYDGLEFAMQMDGSIALAVGPSLTIWPMPGVPITLFPTFAAEVKAYGEVVMSSLADVSRGNATKIDSPNDEVYSLLQAEESATASGIKVDACGAAALLIIGNTDVDMLSLPRAMLEVLSTDWIADAIASAIIDGVATMVNTLLAPLNCFVKVPDKIEETINEAAKKAADELKKLIPSVSIDLSGIPLENIANENLFCLAEVQTDESSPCAEGLTCAAHLAR